MAAVTTERELLERVPRQLLIGGEWRDGGAGTLTVEDPATGEPLVEIADATVEDGVAALAAADEAFASFRTMAPRERGEILRRAYDLMLERAGELALLMTLEMGKPLAESEAEVRYAAAYFRWYAEEAVRINGRFQTAETGASRVLTMRQPVGPCVFVTPWNFPLAMGTRKVGPAIAAGCTCVVKPAAQTPLSMLAMAGILIEAGLPAGVLNVITTSRSSAVVGAVIADPRARKLSFTGSTAVGKRLVAQAAEQLLRVSMELGGNAPFLVFEDADLDLAVEGAMLAKMRNMGEACTSANRFLVHESISDAFSQRLAERMGALKLGRGTEPGVTTGPLIDGSARDGVHELVADAVAQGARCLTGGETVGDRGYFYAPTVLADVPVGARVLTEEIFGPVAPVTRFSEEAEAVALANDTEYGLAAYLFTQDVGRAFRVMEALETGMIGFNQGMVSNAGAPFGGIKHSGYGREGGPEGLDEYLETKYVAMNVGGTPVTP
jgi:succinate-semialdehyde dehydrogenase/glutarate-semialdehyde dehydrogenase